MEEQYKGHVIRVTTEKDNSAFPWKPICRVLDGVSREFIKQIDWPIRYDTSAQAEKVGLMISKKWIDAGSPISKPSLVSVWSPALFSSHCHVSDTIRNLSLFLFY